IGVALVLLAAVIGKTKMPQVETDQLQNTKTGDSIWKHHNLILGAIGNFTYVGAEVSIGSFLVNYFSLPEIAGLTEKSAAGFVSFYWGGAMVGRFLGAPLLRRFRAGNVLAVCAVMAGLLVILSMALSGPTAMWVILAVGLFNSVMFPT